MKSVELQVKVKVPSFTGLKGHFLFWIFSCDFWWDAISKSSNPSLDLPAVCLYWYPGYQSTCSCTQEVKTSMSNSHRSSRGKAGQKGVAKDPSATLSLCQIHRAGAVAHTPLHFPSCQNSSKNSGEGGEADAQVMHQSRLGSTADLSLKHCPFPPVQLLSSTKSLFIPWNRNDLWKQNIRNFAESSWFKFRCLPVGVFALTFFLTHWF